jgi:hypothetical protein
LESEDADDGVVDDDKPLKVYRSKRGYSSDEEVVHYDPKKLNKRTARNTIAPPAKIAGNRRYRLRNTKRRITMPFEMVTACLMNGETEHMQRWVESKVFQNKSVMVFGANQTTTTNDAYQKFLGLAKEGLLETGEIYQPHGFCCLCQSTKPVCRETFVRGERFYFGACCWQRFEVVLRYCEYLTWLDQRAGFGGRERVDDALRQFRRLENQFHSAI